MLAISKELSAEELEFLEAMSRLSDNRYFQLLIGAVEQERDRYISNLARTLAMGAMAPPVDQREIDYKRGFWNGALYAVTQFPKRKAKDWDKFVAEQTKESDEA